MTALTAMSLVLGLAAVPAGSESPSPRTAQIALRNGLRVEVVGLPGARVFALIGRIDAGPLHDPPAQRGIAAIAAEWLAWPLIGENALSPAVRWTRPSEPRLAIAPRWLEFRAAGFPGQEDAVLEVLAGRLAFVARSGIPPERWERFRADAANRAREVAATVEGQLWGPALAALYPSGSSLAVPPWGPSEGAPGEAADLQAFLRARVTPARTRVVLAGDFDLGELRPRLEATLGLVPAGAASPPPPSPERPVRRRTWTEVLLPRPDLRRDQVLVVCPVERSRPSDDLVARALAFFLGRSPAGLAHDLAESGLALSVRAGLAEVGATGLLFARTAASPADTAEVLARARRALDALAAGHVAGAEVEAFLAGERAEQESGDPVRCAERRLLGRPGCGEPPVSLRPGDVAEGARRLFTLGAPLALVLGSGESSAR